MYKKFLSLSLFVLFFLLTICLSNVQALKIGTVNMAVLYNFHPLVQNYVPSVGKFIISKNKKQIGKNYKKNRERISKITNKIVDIKTKISKIDKEKEMVQLQLWRRRRRIETDIESVKKNPANLGKNLDFSSEKKMLKEIDKELFSSLKKLDNKKKKLSQKIKTLNDKLKSINYYTGEEHIAHIHKISDEIIMAIKKVAAQKGITSVLNSGRFHFPKIVKNAKDFNFNHIYDPSEVIMPDTIYDKGYSLDKMVEIHGGLEKSKGILDYQLGLYEKNMRESLKRLAPFVDGNLNDLVLMGGEDITADVLKLILNNYNIDNNIVDTLYKGVKSHKIY